MTISQADGNDSRYDILRPINEKSAIKRFADGLTDPKLSTIISSRQFTSLPEAIRTAIDEQTSSPRDDQIFHYGHNQPRSNYRNNNGRFSHYRGNFKFNRGRNTYGTQYYSNFNNRPYVSQVSQPDPVQRPSQYFARSARGGQRPRGSPHRAPARVQHLSDDTAHSTSVNNNDNDNMQFFRE